MPKEMNEDFTTEIIKLNLIFKKTWSVDIYRNNIFLSWNSSGMGLLAVVSGWNE